MDFPQAPAIVAALKAKAESGNLGYPTATGEPGLIEAVQSRMQRKYQWQLQGEDLWFINRVISGLYLSCLALASEGDEVIVFPPIYPPFISAVKDTGRKLRYRPLSWDGERYRIDFEQLERAINPATRVILLCNPHNPTGRVFTRDELTRLAEIALKNKLWVVSDELHAELVYPGHEHIPFASLSDEIAERTVTLFGPTKAFNIAGLKLGILASSNRALLKHLKKRGAGLVSGPNVMAQTATLAAYTKGDGWLDNTLGYLAENRALVERFIRERLPQVRHAPPEGTYLAWLDFRELNLGENPSEALLEHCKVGLNPGPSFGSGGDGFARLNFATSKPILEEALERIASGLKPYLD